MRENTFLVKASNSKNFQQNISYFHIINNNKKFVSCWYANINIFQAYSLLKYTWISRVNWVHKKRQLFFLQLTYNKSLVQ